MRIVVTGATSFIGAATVRQLLEAGHQVFAVVRPASSNMKHLQEMAEGIDCGTLAIRPLDLANIRELAGFFADAWIHIGWDGAGSENRTKRDVQQKNVTYALDAIETAAALGCRRFLFTGSQAEYGVWHQTVAEDTPCHPVSEYGKAKVHFCEKAKILCKRKNMEYIHTRIYSVYGPGDHPWSLVQSCLRTFLEGGSMKLGECTQNWNFLYIDDAAAALVALLTGGKAGIYNIGSTDTRPLRRYIEEMHALCGHRGSFTYGERPQNAEGPADLMPDISKLLRETSWRPVRTFAEGIYETLHSLREDPAGKESL